MYLSLEAWCRQCIGTTEEYCKPTVPVASVGDLPYKDVKLRLRKPHDETGPEFDEVQQGKHKLKGYTGHIHGHHVNNNDFTTHTPPSSFHFHSFFDESYCHCAFEDIILLLRSCCEI
jgi:hypothetical protein